MQILFIINLVMVGFHVSTRPTKSEIALANNPPQMAKAMGLATITGRMAYLAGRMPIKNYANASSPLTGVVN